jgi:hypothetical protein
MRARALLMSLCAALAVGAAASAAKPQEPSASQLRPLERDALYVGRWSAAQMLGTEVRTNNDEPLGVVTDLIVGDDGALHTLVIATRAALANGEPYIGVPWPDVTLAAKLRWVEVPLAQVRDGSYALFNRRPRSGWLADSREWRVRELIGDFASLTDVPRYGLVSDVLFDRQGKARAVVVARGAGTWGAAGLYAYPWIGYANDVGAYTLPFSSTEAFSVQRFDYARLGEMSRLARGERSAAAGASRK